MTNWAQIKKYINNKFYSFILFIYLGKSSMGKTEVEILCSNEEKNWMLAYGFSLHSLTNKMTSH